MTYDGDIFLSEIRLYHIKLQPKSNIAKILQLRFATHLRKKKNEKIKNSQ